MGKFLVALKALGKWFEKRKRVLPWRDQPTVYRVWVSEIMLQQTQVAAVIPFFERFLVRFPTVEDLARAPVEEVLKAWAGLGYYSRARNLHRAAQAIVAAGKFPVDREGWLELPGIGNYTAGAILSIASNQVEAILDANVERVLSRVRRCNRQKGDSNFKQRLWRISKIFVESANRHRIQPRVLNQALMELGALVCTPKKPKCDVCPLNGICRANNVGDQETYPPKKKPKEWVRVDESFHCVIREGQGRATGEVLLRMRAPGEWRAGLWDLLEEVPKGLRLLELGNVETRHTVTRHKIERRTQIWKMIEGKPRAEKKQLLRAAENLKKIENSEVRWVSLDHPELEVPVGSALKKTLQRIREQGIGHAKTDS